MLIGSITLISGTFDLLTSEAPGPVAHVYFFNMVYTAGCTFFCSLLLTQIYSRVQGRHKLAEFFVFFLCVFAGVYLGMISAHFALTGDLVYITLRSLILPMIFGFVASLAMTAYSILNMRLEEKINRLKAAAKENEQLKRLESEARLASLQAKLNPHFLFNTLNSLAALIYDDQARAEKGIVRLSDVYRRVLSISHRTMVPLKEELTLIRDYLELEALRFEDQLVYHIDCPESLHEMAVPGLLIEPLVSNVIKHGLERTDQTVHIQLTLSRLDERLQIEVKDDGPGYDQERAVPGYGHTSIQERLKLIYGDDYTFRIVSVPDRGVSVSINLPSSLPQDAEQEAAS